MKSNKVLVALIGCMLTFSGVSFASDTSSGAMSNYLNSWFNAKRAALGSWAAEQPKELKSWATEKYRYLSGETEREQREKEQLRQRVNYFVELKEFSTPLSKMNAIKNVRDFFGVLSSEKVEKQMVLEACDEKLAELKIGQQTMRQQEAEIRRKQEEQEVEMHRKASERYREQDRKQAFQEREQKAQEARMLHLERENHMNLEREEKEKRGGMRKAVLAKDINLTTRNSIIFDLEKSGLISMEDRDRLLNFSRDNDKVGIENAIESVKQIGNPDSKPLLDKLNRIKLLMH